METPFNGSNLRIDKRLREALARSKIQPTGLHRRGGVMKAGDTRDRDMWRGTKRIIPMLILCGGLVAGASHISRLAARVPISTPINDKQAALRADHSLEQSLTKGDKTTVGQLLDADFTWTDAKG